MSYYALPYQVLFHDTMAYGSHHHMTNFKFQNYARETMLFGSDTPGNEPWQEQLKDIVMLTREAYSFNMAPVNLGEKVAVIMSYEEPTRSTVRLCFRTVKEDGSPVNCGFQTMVLVHKDTGNLVPGPQIMTQYLDRSKAYCILEDDTQTSFKEKVLTGGTFIKEIFSPEIINIGKHVANSPKESGHPRIIDTQLREYSLITGQQVALKQTSPVSISPTGSLVFTFPGQGAYSYEGLKALYNEFEDTRELFHTADAITQKLLGKPFLPLIQAENKAVHDKLLAFYPDLNQIGIYLSEVIVAHQYLKRGLKPDLLLGHSFGEIAALAMAGVYTIEEGIEIVCHRVLALHHVRARGCMAATYCDKEKMSRILAQYQGHSIEITVCNHPKQTVVSGITQDIDWLTSILAKEGISLTKLDSAYPFHSSFLTEAVAPFKQSLSKFNFTPAKIPVYHCTENKLYEHGEDVSEILSSQFVKTLDFRNILLSLQAQGYKQFIECATGNILTKITQKNFPSHPQIHTYASEVYDKTFAKSIEDNIVVYNTGGPAVKPNSVPQPSSNGNGHKPAVRIPAPPSTKPIANGTTNGTAASPAQAAKPSPTIKKDPEMPIAIVSAGCFLPGADSPETFWENIKKGVNGVKNLGETDPLAKLDFVAGKDTDITPDKTYALITGNISKEDIGYPEELLKTYYSLDEFNILTRGQRLLAVALAQTKLSLQYKTDKTVPVIIGSTADGSTEYDESTFLEKTIDSLMEMGLEEDKESTMTEVLEGLMGYSYGESEDLRQTKVYREVVERIIGDNTYTYVVDSACSSSLYSLNLGIKSLLSHESDVVLAGGVFAPGPANNTLFAQFRGLTPNQSRPLDHKADGVVFSDGGCIVALKRLSDALNDGDEIMGVVRGMGLSSDGKSPSINVPQSKGQSMAVKRAYENAQLDPATVQYIEAHATSTPVGDSVEFNSLKSYFKEHFQQGQKMQLGSVKSLIGHTGWVSGVASVLKICYAFKEGIIPKQYNYESPNTNIELGDSPFYISTEEKAWPTNVNNLPRRAGINSFGFGGTNGHLILEAFDPTYHKKLASEIKDTPKAKQDIVIVDMGKVFPTEEELASTSTTDMSEFDRSKTKLPKKKMLLPDVVEHMDISQFLAPLAVEQILDKLPESWKEHSENIGVVLGMMTKTDRGIEANQRVFLDKLARIFEEYEVGEGKDKAEVKELLHQLIQYVRDNKMPSGPYTLPGLMPNVTPSRVNSLYNLNGPNFVIDMDENSLTQSIKASEQLLQYGDCEVVFTGSVNARNAVIAEEKESALILAMTTADFARSNNWPILSYLKVEETKNQEDLALTEDKEAHFGASEGILEIIDGVQQVKEKGEKIVLKSDYTHTGVVSQFTLAKHTLNPKPVIKAESNGKKSDADPFEFIAQTPVYQGTPVLVEEAAEEASISLKDRKLLIVTDQLDQVLEEETQETLKAYDYHLVTTGKGNKSGDFINIKVEDEEAMMKSMEKLNDLTYDAIIILKDLKDYSADALLENDFTKEKFHELIFAVCKYHYSRLEDKSLILGSLTFNALIEDNLNPYTGLIAGFLKSVIKELPESNCRILNTSSDSLSEAIAQLETEFGQTKNKAEITYKQGVRHVIQFKSMASLSQPDTQYLNEDSVLLVTGGGRGVTAVLVEKLIEVYGCTVIALGRTSLEGVPEHILDMSMEEYKDYESVFYREELAKDKTQKIPELKKRYWRYQAANELSQVIKTCEALGGKFEYVAVDINNKTAINKLVKRIFKDYGKLDMVVHGAGVQVSKLLPNKDFYDFQRIVSTKLLSLNHLYKACEKNRGEHKVHYHLLTSAFSYMGNDGQPDYGAANETMNRLAEALNNKQEGIYWSTIAWLGWAAIGMTRGSEFAALAMRRKLRGVTKEEGQFIFMDLVNGAPKAPSVILLADGEIDFYNLELQNELIPIPFPEKERVNHHRITVYNTPILLDHKINDIPTIPGAMVISMAGEAAKEMRPHLHVESFTDTSFQKFNRVFEDRGLDLKIDCQVIEETTKSARIRVRFMTDFYHKNGLLLQQDIVLTETFVEMADEIPTPELTPIDTNTEGSNYPDPYVLGTNSNVSLKGHFDAMNNIIVGEANRTAGYKLSDEPMIESELNYILPNMIMVDAFWRFGTVQPVGENKLAVFVPEKCGQMRVFFDFTNYDLDMLRSPLTFVGHNPREKGDQLEVGPIQVLDKDNNVILLVEKGVCRKFDEIELVETAVSN